MISDKDLDQRIQKIADLLVDIAWSENDILPSAKKPSSVNADKVDPVQAEYLNYGSH